MLRYRRRGRGFFGALFDVSADRELQIWGGLRRRRVAGAPHDRDRHLDVGVHALVHRARAGHPLQGGALFRTSIYHSHSVEEVLDRIEEYFEAIETGRPYYGEAIRMYEEGLADIATIGRSRVAGLARTVRSQRLQRLIADSVVEL
mgnify:CR=1 FL=1